MKKYSAGVIGFGGMGKKHSRVLEKISGVEKIHIFDPLFNNNNTPGIFFEETLDLLIKNVDYAVVAVPTSNHLEICEKLAAERIPTLLEKPATQNVTCAKKIKMFYEFTETKIMVGYVEKYNPSLIELKQNIQDGVIGKIKSISTARLSSLPERKIDIGVLLDLGSHDLNFTSWLLEEDYKQLISFSQKSKHNIDEQVNIIGTMNSGVLVSHCVSWNSPLKERVVKVYGTKGLLICDLAKQDLTLVNQTSKKIDWSDYVNISGLYSSELKVFSINKKEPLVEEHKAFLNYIENNTENYNSIEGAINTLQIIENLTRKGRFN